MEWKGARHFTFRSRPRAIGLSNRDPSRSGGGQIEGQAAAHGIPRERVIREILLAREPSKRFATVEEMGAIVVFLASDGAASITGVALPADGGWTAH